MKSRGQKCIVLSANLFSAWVQQDYPSSYEEKKEIGEAFFQFRLLESEYWKPWNPAIKKYINETR